MERADACGPIFIFICTDLYYWIPIILVAGIVILPFVPIYLSPPLPQTIRRDLYPPRFPLSFSLPPSSLFSFTFTLSLLVAATKLSAKGGDLRPRSLPDSSTSNRLVHRLKSFFNNRPPSIVSDIYSTTLHERVSSLSSRYILDIMLISCSVYKIGDGKKQFLFVSSLNLYIFISDYYLYYYYYLRKGRRIELNTSWTTFTLGAISVPRLPLSQEHSLPSLPRSFFFLLFSRIIECWGGSAALKALAGHRH